VVRDKLWAVNLRALLSIGSKNWRGDMAMEIQSIKKMD